VRDRERENRKKVRDIGRNKTTGRKEGKANEICTTK
jgi:hypothetical protein